MVYMLINITVHTFISVENYKKWFMFLHVTVYFEACSNKCTFRVACKQTLQILVALILLSTMFMFMNI